MTERLTVIDLLTTQQISEDDIAALVHAFVSEPRPGLFDLATGYCLNIVGAINDNPLVREILSRIGASDELKRSAVRTALMQATPLKA